MVLHEKGLDFDTYEVDLRNKSEEFLAASPTGKVPVVVADGDSLYESNVVNEYLDEVYDEPRLMPEDPKRRAQARVWMAFADSDFFPAVFAASVGRSRGFSEERISEGFEKLEKMLDRLENRLGEHEFLADEFSLAEVAYAGNMVHLRELEERDELSLENYPKVATWLDEIESRKSYKAAL